MNNTLIAAIIGTAIVAGGAGYVIGAKKAVPTSQEGRGQFGNREGRGGPGGRRGPGFAAGEVIAKDDTSITVKKPDGSTQIVLVTASTEVMKAVEGTKDDVAVGKNVMVNGAPNQDGSVTAQSINLRPAGMPFPGRRDAAQPTAAPAQNQ